MQLRLEQLANDLKQQLRPIYFVSGDEPLLMQEALDEIRAKCRAEGFSERIVMDVDRHFDWNSLTEEANALSLFADKKLIELRLGSSKPGVPGAKALSEYVELAPEDCVLLIESKKLDGSTQKSKWVNKLKDAGAMIQIWPVGLNEMPRWLKQRAQKLQLNIDQDAISLLCDRLEGNLLAAQQELEKLKLLNAEGSIDASAVLDSVSDHSRYDIFNLTDACLAGDSEQTIKIISNLRLEGFEVTIALWALSKEIRLLLALTLAAEQGLPQKNVFQQFRVIQKRQALLSKACSRIGRTQLTLLLDQCKQVDDLIKGVDKGMSPWDVIMDIGLALSGKRVLA